MTANISTTQKEGGGGKECIYFLSGETEGTETIYQEGFGSSEKEREDCQKKNEPRMINIHKGLGGGGSVTLK